MMADKNLVVVAVNNTRPKNYRTIRVEGIRLSWASFSWLPEVSLGAAVMLLHNILDGGVDAACSYYSGTVYNCDSQSPPLVVIPMSPLSNTTAWYLGNNKITAINNR